ANPADSHCFRHSVFGIGSKVGDVDELAPHYHSPGDCLAIGGEGPSTQQGVELFVTRGRCDKAINLALPDRHPCAIRIAKPSGCLNEGIQDRLEVEGRTADGLQHIACPGLEFERLLEISSAPAEFARQPRILHRDHRLCGKVLQQRDLFVGERPHLLAVDDHCAQQNVVLEQPYCDLAADTPELSLLSERRNRKISPFLTDLGNLDNSSTARASSQRYAWMWPKSTNPPRPLDPAQFTGRRSRVKVFTVESKEVTMRRLAKSYRLFEHCVEHRREVAGRAVDDPQYLGGS